MIETKDITKMVAHILKRDKGIADTNIMHPAREWFLGLGITTLVILFGSWFCFYLYSYHSTEMKKEVVVIEQAVPYQAASVKSALELFATRQEKITEILGGRNIVVPVQINDRSTSTPDTDRTEAADVEPELIIDPAPTVDDSEASGDAVLAP